MNDFAVPVLFIVGGVTLFFALLLGFINGDLIRFIAWLSRPFLPEVMPRVAYKRARVTELGFAGVGADVSYGVKSRAHGLGFHAYKELDDALSHNQPGDVFLEVLLSGTVREHHKGYIASRQRVLQVISDHCVYCHASGTYFANNSSGLTFFCGFHAAAATPGFIGIVTRLSQPATVPKQRGIRPLSEFADSYGWLKDADVGVTSQSRRDGFAPTSAPEKAS